MSKQRVIKMYASYQGRVTVHFDKFPSKRIHLDVTEASMQRLIGVISQMNNAGTVVVRPFTAFAVGWVATEVK